MIEVSEIGTKEGTPLTLSIFKENKCINNLFLETLRLVFLSEYSKTDYMYNYIVSPETFLTLLMWFRFLPCMPTITHLISKFMQHLFSFYQSNNN